MQGMHVLEEAVGQEHVVVHVADSDTIHPDQGLAGCREEVKLARGLELQWLEAVQTMGALKR